MAKRIVVAAFVSALSLFGVASPASAAHTHHVTTTAHHSGASGGVTALHFIDWD